MQQQEQDLYQAMCYRGAIALNNTGVSLLERGMIRQAYETLQDSIEMVRAMFPTDKESTVKRQDVNAKLLQASQRCAATESQVSDTPQRFVVQVMSFDPSGLGVLDILHANPSTNTFYPIRFDLPSSNADLETNAAEPDIESSVILYNFGLSSFLLSKIRKGFSSAARSNSLRILNLSSSVISKRATTCQDAVEEAMLICVGFYVIGAIIVVLIADGNDEQACLAHERYKLFYTAVTDLRQSEWFGESLLKAAAAA